MAKTGLESAAYFGLYDYEEGFKKVKAHGYDCVDYSELCNRNSDLYSFEPQKFRSFLQDVAASASRSGVEIFQLHGLWPTDDTTEENRQETLSYFIKEIEAAHYLKCKNVVIHPSLPYGWGQETDKDKIWNVNIELFGALMPYAEKYGVTVCVENLPFKAVDISEVKQLKKLVRKIDNPHLKICYDTGHANMYHNNIGEDILLIGDDLAALHVHDNKGNWDQHLIPYQGTANWEGFLLALKEIGYKGCFSLETYISRRMPQPMREEMQIALSKLAREMAQKIE